MLERITPEELTFMECLCDPIAATEIIFSDLENLTAEPVMQLGRVRLGQIPMFSFEYLLDYDHKLTKKENFKLREGAGNIDAFGGRLFGKTHIVETIDILISMIWLDHEEVGFTSTDAIHIRGILEEKVIPVLSNHPFYQMLMPDTASRGITRSPNYRISARNGYTLIGINMNLQSKDPGGQFYQKHLKRLYIEEASFETDAVYNKRIDARSEIGCVTRCAGMTNFTKYSPTGKRFYSLANKAWVCNLPQYVNPNWDEATKQKAIEKHGGEQSITYRMFVKGEVVEDGVAVFDMERVRRHYLEGKDTKVFEITKQNFINFKDIIIVDRPKGVDDIFISADIGESAPTEIAIMFKQGEKFIYVYNITCYNLTDQQQPQIFDYLIDKLSASVVAIDTTDGTGRAIYRNLAQRYPEDNLVWVGFNEKLDVGFETDERGSVIVKEGKPVCKEEFVSEWSVIRLKHMLYEGILRCPVDYKLDPQLNSVISKQTQSRTVYVVAHGEDHLFAAFRVFAIAAWKKEFAKLRPMHSKKFDKAGV